MSEGFHPKLVVNNSDDSVLKFKKAQNEVRYIKLVTGEELLANVVEKAGNTQNGMNKQYSLQDPMRIVMIPASRPGESPGIALTPWCQFADEDEIMVDSYHVIAIMKPVDAFITEYQRNTSSLALPEKPKLII